MKLYVVAITSGPYMMAEDNNKVYKRKSAAIKRCEALNRNLKKSLTNA